MYSLSGGMRQNAYIAMALAQNTDYILLDEPTTYLDIAHQIDLIKTLKALAKNGKGILAVMHDLPLAFTFSDKIAVMDQGKIIMLASPQEIVTTKIIEKLFNVSMVVSETGIYSYHYQ